MPQPRALSALATFARDRSFPLALSGVVAALAAIRISNALGRAMDINQNNRFTVALYPWMVRLDLLAVLALGIGVAHLAKRYAAANGVRVSPGGLVGLALAGAAALAVVVGIVINPVAGILVLATLAGTVWLAPRLAGSADRDVLLLLGGAGAIRLVCALGLSGFGMLAHGSAIVFDDEQAYQYAARQAAVALSRGVGDLDAEWQHLIGPHLDLLGFFYATAGPHFLVLRILNVALGTLVVAAAFGIADALFGRPQARLAALIAAVWPTMVLWSGSGLREPLIWLTALLVAWLLVCGRQPALRAAMPAIGVFGFLSAWSLSALRPAVVIALVAALIVALVYAVAPRLSTLYRVVSLALLVLALVSAALIVARSGTVATVMALLSPRAIEFRAASTELTPMVEHDHTKLPPAPDDSSRNLGTIVRTPYPDDAHLRTGILSWYYNDVQEYEVRLDEDTVVLRPWDQVYPLTNDNIGWDAVLGRFATGLRLFLVPESLWQGTSIQKTLIGVDTLAWDVMLVLGLVTAVRYRRGLSPVTLFVVANCVFLVTGLALASTNLGTVLRHRTMLLPWLVVLVAPTVLDLVARYPIVPSRWRARLAMGASAKQLTAP